MRMCMHVSMCVCVCGMVWWRGTQQEGLSTHYRTISYLHTVMYVMENVGNKRSFVSFVFCITDCIMYTHTHIHVGFFLRNYLILLRCIYTKYLKKYSNKINTQIFRMLCVYTVQHIHAYAKCTFLYIWRIWQDMIFQLNMYI